GVTRTKVQTCDEPPRVQEPAFCASLDAAAAAPAPSTALPDDGVTHPRGYSVTLSQPLFVGFQNLNAIRQAKATVQAGREGLRATEQTTLLNALTAYVDVVRDQ